MASAGTSRRPGNRSNMSFPARIPTRARRYFRMTKNSRTSPARTTGLRAQIQPDADRLESGAETILPLANKRPTRQGRTCRRTRLRREAFRSRRILKSHAYRAETSSGWSRARQCLRRRLPRPLSRRSSPITPMLRRSSAPNRHGRACPGLSRPSTSVRRTGLPRAVGARSASLGPRQSRTTWMIWTSPAMTENGHGNQTTKPFVSC
jgi:hypothetical protein